MSEPAAAVFRWDIVAAPPLEQPRPPGVLRHYTVWRRRMRPGAPETDPEPTVIAHTLSGARRVIPPGRHRVPRQTGDPDERIETWLDPG